MRICDLTTLYLDGGESGVNTYVQEKARFVERHRPDLSHVLIVPGRRNETRRIFGSTVHLVKSPPIPGKADHRILTDLGRARSILASESPDLVETDCVYFLGRVARAALPKVPIVGFYHVHLPSFIARPYFARFGPKVATLVERLAWRFVRFCSWPLDRIVVSSRDVERRLVAAGLERLEYVPLGVNLDLFRNGLSRHPPGRGADTGRPIVILHVGRLSPEKNQADLIDAFKILSARGRYELRIVGDGPSRRDLERRAAGLERVVFLGSRAYAEEMPRLYARADILAQSSPNETFSLTILEALASGLPVVAVRQGGPTDLVTPARGELALPGDPADLAAKIERVATSSGEYGVSRAELEPHSWRKTFERLFQVYESTFAARPVRPSGLELAGEPEPEPTEEALAAAATGG